MSLFKKNSTIDGLKIVRPWCSDKSEIIGRCFVDGASPSLLLQKDGIYRSQTTHAELILDLGSDQTFDTVVLAKTNLTENALVKIEASDDIGGLFGIYSNTYDAQTAIVAGHVFPDACGDDWPFTTPTTTASVYFSTGEFTPLCDDNSCELEFIACGYQPDIVWQGSSVVNMRYVKISIYDPSNSDGFIQAQRLMIDEAWTGSCDVSTGWGVTVIDKAETIRTRTGKVINGCGARWREFKGSYNTGSAASDIYGWDLRYGKSADVFIIPPVIDSCQLQTYGFWAHPIDPSELVHVRCGTFSKAVGFTEVSGFVPCKKTEVELERIITNISLVTQDVDGIARFSISTSLSPIVQQPVYSIYSQPSNGDVDVDPASGDVEYTPDSGFSGIDEFKIAATLPSGQQDIETVQVEIN